MKMTCKLTAQEVYDLIGKNLTKRRIKWSELNVCMQPSMIFDMPDTFDGVTFQVEFDDDEDHDANSYT